MLNKLTIKNVALIDRAEIDFSDGLNVLSGETGSGKSVIIESLNFVLGAKAEKSLIKSGETECFVSAEFDVSENKDIDQIFEETGIEKEDLFIVKRIFSDNGKGKIFINGESTTLSVLKKFTSLLIDVHGQSEHFSLLKNINQLELLDRFGEKKIKEIKEELSFKYAELKNIRAKIKENGGNESERLMCLDILEYQINEIETLDLKENEEEDLIAKRLKINNIEKIVTALAGVKSAIKDEGGIDDILSNVVRLSNSIRNLGEEYGEIADRLNSALEEIDDICDSAENMLDSVQDEDLDADYIENRLDAIKKAKKKYGNGFSEINDFLLKAKEERENLINFAENAEKLAKSLEKTKKEVYAIYQKLSKARKDASKIFSQRVTEHLVELNMPKAVFDIRFNEFPNFEDCAFNSENGADEIEFIFSANFGESPKPLSEVISGGEMSRFMLAVKAQTAKYGGVSTFIFDEIDAGISGNTAKKVAEKFARISKDAQIIAISHLPQISAMADTNLYIYKEENGKGTTTKVLLLDENTKKEEIIRLIGGNKTDENAVKLAEKLIADAVEYKKSVL